MADRRTFLQGLLAASVAIPAALPAVASGAVDPDAELIALYQEWAVANDRLNGIWQAAEDAADRIGDGPAVPDELFPRSRDPFCFRSCTSKDPSSGRRWYGRQEHIESLRSLDLNSFPDMILPDGSIRPAVPNLQSRARRDEVVEAYDRWRAAHAAMAEATGLTAAIAQRDAEIEINAALRRRIINIPATTLKGLIVKARIAADCHGGLEELEHDTFTGSPTNEALMCSMMLDLLQMGDSGLFQPGF